MTIITAPPLEGSFGDAQLGVDTSWTDAEALIVERVTGLTRCDAEKWAVAHERQRTQITLTHSRVAYLLAASTGPAASYLEAAFHRIEWAVRRSPFATRRPLGRDEQQVVEELVSAVTEVAQHALATVVLCGPAPADPRAS